MHSQPSRTFIILAVLMAFLLVIGLGVVGMLVITNHSPSPLELTRSSIISMNDVGPAILWGTATLHAAQTQTATFKPNYYTADMSPTVLPVLPTPTPTLTPTQTFTQLAYSACSWQWARQDLPKLGQGALQAFIDANMSFVEVRAEAYGENCIDGATNQVNYFAAMTTDFYLTAPAGDISMGKELAEFVTEIYKVLIDLPETDLPARLGYLDITFTVDNGEKRLRTTFDEIKAALDKRLTGAAFLEALGGIK